MKRAVIVGCLGQDGRILWEQLAAQDISLVGIHRGGVDSYKADWNDQVDIQNPDSVARLIAEFEPEQIYFLAAYHQSSQENVLADTDLWKKSFGVHVEAFSHFLSAARTCNRPPSIFYASSSRIYGNSSKCPQTESTTVAPACLYGITKVTGMLMADFFRKQHGLRICCGILYNHESPLRASQFLSQRVVEGLAQCKLGRAQQLEIGDLDARVDWGYAPDYTRAMQMILDSGLNENFVIASGKPHSVRDWIEIASDQMDVDWQAFVVENPKLLSRPTQPLCGDPSQLCRVTGWHPQVTFEQMVRIMADAAIFRVSARPPNGE